MKRKQTMKQQIMKIPAIRVDRRSGKIIIDLSSEADWLQQRRKTAKKKGGEHD
jgi:hypothetical protein